MISPNSMEGQVRAWLDDEPNTTPGSNTAKAAALALLETARQVGRLADALDRMSWRTR